MNKGVVSGVRKYNTTNNDPSTSLVIDKSIGGVLRFFPYGTTPTTKNALDTTLNPIANRPVPNLSTTFGLMTWVTRAPNLGTNNINAISYINNSFTAGSSNGLLSASTDGVTWTTRVSGITGTSITAFALDSSNKVMVVGASGANSISVSSAATSWVPHNRLPYELQANAVAFGDNIWLAGGSINALGQGLSLSDGTYSGPTTWVSASPSFGAVSMDGVAYGNNVFLAGIFDSAAVLASGDGVTWATVFSFGGGTALGNNTVSFLNGIFLVGSGNGTVGVSTDGVTWTTSTLGSNNFIRGFTYGNGIHLAVNQSSGLAYRSSNNGATWTGASLNVSLSTSAYACAFGNGLFVVGGQGGFIRTSTDGITWTTRTSNFGTTSIFTIVFGNGIFIASDFAGTAIRTSTDGITWDTSTSSFAPIHFDGTLFKTVSGGALRSSTDGVTWTTIVGTPISTPRNMIYANGLHIITDFASTGRLFTRFDSTLNWYPQAQVFNSAQINAIAFANNTFIVGLSNGGLFKTTNTTLNSTGTTWATVTGNAGTNNMLAVAFGNSIWVAGGGAGVIRTSPNGLTWTTQTSNFGTTNVFGLAFGNNLWVAVGNTGTLRTSTDAVTWVTQTSNFGTSDINTVAFGNNIFIASGTAATRTSTDGVTWVTASADSFSALVYANSTWVGVGGSGIIKTSTDGATWVTQTSNTTSNLGAVAFGNNLFVAGGAGGVIRTSTDAITWTTQTSTFTTQINGIAFSNNVWTAVGAGGNIRTSTDAVTWTTRTSTFGTSDITEVASNGANLLIAVGVGGSFRSSAPGLTWTTLTANMGTNGIFAVTYQNNLWVAAGANGALRTSTDTTTWITRPTFFGATSIRSLAYGNGLWIAGGDNGTLNSSFDSFVWSTQVSTFGGTSAISAAAYYNNLFVIGGVGGQVRTHNIVSSDYSNIVNSVSLPSTNTLYPTVIGRFNS